MNKIFKSKKSKKKHIKKIISMLLISFLCAIILRKLPIFNNINFINKLKYIGLNEINSDVKLKGNYFLNIGLNSLDKVKFEKVIVKESKKNNTSDIKIYIYNTHQTEEYKTLENYNLTPTVYTASYILKDMLKEYNINALVEDSNLVNELNSKGLTYYDAYDVSRGWLENLNNDNLLLYIDLHRDSIDYQYSNILVEGKDYAKIMFVVGLNHDYEKNMEVAQKLVNNIEKINKNISRGIYTRKSAVFNQDFNNNCVLIELGGPDSTYESISNSLSVLALAIKNYLGE